MAWKWHGDPSREKDHWKWQCPPSSGKDSAGWKCATLGWEWKYSNQAHEAPQDLPMRVQAEAQDTVMLIGFSWRGKRDKSRIQQYQHHQLRLWEQDSALHWRDKYEQGELRTLQAGSGTGVDETGRARERSSQMSEARGRKGFIEQDLVGERRTSVHSLMPPWTRDEAMQARQ